ncbi:hypothetical protein GCM10022223_22910 [Kineosporia mesophila]|uniref:Uncharacterized protein n=1 Tax=Kineosporia mesophila TaxID=566012 RepID=A0ABP6ZHL5_9ACTN
MSVAESKELPGNAAEGQEPVKPADDRVVDVPAEPESPTSYRLRRAPRYRAFGFTGAAIGILIGAVIALSTQVAGDYSEQTILGYFVAIFGLFGALLGCGSAVLLDRRKD